MYLANRNLATLAKLASDFLLRGKPVNLNRFKRYHFGDTSLQKAISVNRPAIVREIQHFGLFPAFLPEHPAFLALFRITKIAENRNNFKLWRHFVRKSSAKTAVLASHTY